MQFRKEKMVDLLKELAGNFLKFNSNGTSLITVTDVRMSDSLSLANIYVTVFPDNKETAAIDFLKRNRGDFKRFVLANAKLPKVPFFDFEIDRGEKHRQKLDEISTEIHKEEKYS